MNISAYDSSSISTLFSSMNSSVSNSRTSNNLLGLGSLSGTLSDYASIRNGSYSKLMRAYYDKVDTNSNVTNPLNNSISNITADSVKTLKGIKSDADDLNTSAKALMDKTLYEKKTTTAADGTKTENYDMDTLYKKVSAFVEDYNDVVESTGRSDTTTILMSSSSMVSSTAKNADLLKEIGVTIGSDNTLSINKDTFQKADVSKIKSLFTGAGSYGYTTASRASGISSYASSEAAKTGTYGSSGTYNYSFGTGTSISTGI